MIELVSQKQLNSIKTNKAKKIDPSHADIPFGMLVLPDLHTNFCFLVVFSTSMLCRCRVGHVLLGYCGLLGDVLIRLGAEQMLRFFVLLDKITTTATPCFQKIFGCAADEMGLRALADLVALEHQRYTSKTAIGRCPETEARCIDWRIACEILIFVKTMVSLAKGNTC